MGVQETEVDVQREDQNPTRTPSSRQHAQTPHSHTMRDDHSKPGLSLYQLLDVVEEKMGGTAETPK